MFVTILIMFKKERNSELKDDEDQIKIDIIQSYKMLWSIFKIKHMKLLLMAILTSMVNIFLELFSGKLDRIILQT